MIQQNQFGSNSTKDPNAHLANFMKICNTIKLNGLTDDVIKLRLFPFSLRDKAKQWLHFHAPNTFTNQTNLSRAFLNKYFQFVKTAELRMYQFTQYDGESLYETWERFKGLLRKCPQHGLPN